MNIRVHNDRPTDCRDVWGASWVVNYELLAEARTPVGDAARVTS
jgi:hypothetical protein